MKHTFKDRNYLYLALILAAGLALRLLVLQVRWINPDEGAHLLDARFMLEGLVPIVDYEARQPFYLFMIAVFLKLFGISYKVGRLMPLCATLGTGVMLFLLGRRLFSSKTGLIAAAIFLVLPLTLAWSTVVKTEPLAIFLACASMFFVLKSVDNSLYRLGWMLMAGIFAALAYYSRQLSLYLPLVITLYLLIRREVNIKQTLTQLLLFFLGYLSICVTVFALFLTRMSFKEIVMSQLNPFYIVLYNILHLLGMLPQELQVAVSSGIRVLNQPVSITLDQWENSFFFSLFIVIGALAVGIRSVFGSYNDNRIKDNLAKHKNSYLLLLLWFSLVLLPYILQSIVRGFYTTYFIELLPPLILIASVYFEVIYVKLKVSFLSFLAFSFGWLYVFFIFQKVFWQFYPGVGFYAVIGAMLASTSLYFYSRKWEIRALIILNLVSALVVSLLFYTFKELEFGELLSTLLTLLALYFVVRVLGFRLMCSRDIRMDSFARVFIVIVAFTITGAFSGRFIGPQYSSMWSPRTIKEVNSILRQKSEPNDQVMSGATIWVLENNLEPFLMVSHPTEFLIQAWPDFEKQFLANKPKFIIVDGFTEKKYERFWPFITAQMEKYYLDIARVNDPKSPVKIYMLSEEMTEPQSLFTFYGGK
ncbi:MAG TPA: glycosyltransferase family 39 protein [bacterium]|nr:glycosyltransferase family 39 protein [bacterium]HPN44921.1 glycosyltransferase family 39 protein [bacterium]